MPNWIIILVSMSTPFIVIIVGIINNKKSTRLNFEEQYTLNVKVRTKELIEKAWSEYVKLESDILAIFPRLDSLPIDKKEAEKIRVERMKKAIQSYNDFLNFLRVLELYANKDTITAFNNSLNAVYRLYVDIEYFLEMKRNKPSQAQEDYREVSKQVYQNNPKIISKVKTVLLENVRLSVL